MFSELCRIGKDAELRHTPSGKAVCNLALAYDIGYGDNKKTQWIDGALWDKQAEAMWSHLTKGTQVQVTFDDIEAEAYTANNGEARAKLKGTIKKIKFAGPKQERSAVTPAARPAASTKDAPGVDDYNDDDIPF
jgi:single-strand DNA-binding protein